MKEMPRDSCVLYNKIAHQDAEEMLEHYATMLAETNEASIVKQRIPDQIDEDIIPNGVTDIEPTNEGDD